MSRVKKLNECQRVMLFYNIRILFIGLKVRSFFFLERRLITR